MKRQIENVLKESTIKTFEDICFIYQVPELKDDQKNMALEAVAEVNFRGNFTGKLVIETRGGLFSAIAANMLSNDVPEDRQKKDALGEVANIICGNVVPSLGRSEPEYKIEGPRCLNKDDLLKEEKQEKPLAEITLNFNQGRADIKLFVNNYSATQEK
jgi:CheY-specific phosphatase CheX